MATENLVRFGCVRYAYGQTDKQTDMLITILYTTTGVE